MTKSPYVSNTMLMLIEFLEFRCREGDIKTEGTPETDRVCWGRPEIHEKGKFLTDYKSLHFNLLQIIRVLANLGGICKFNMLM